MEKYSAIFPFSLEKAKRITEGKDGGKIVTRKGEDVRILCFDALKEYNIVALIKRTDDKECIETYKDNGFCYECECEDDLLIEIPIPAKINLGGLKPFDKVLVRDEDEDKWRADFFSHIDESSDLPYVCMSNVWGQCIPYEGNERLLRTTNDPE